MNTTDPLGAVAADSVVTVVAVDIAPDLPQLRELHPHPQLLRVWILGALAFVVPAVLIGLTISVFTERWLIGSMAVIVGISMLVFVTVYGGAWLARFRCRVLADGIWVDRGVWWRSEIFVPRARVQHTDVQQGPIARRYGIASLKVFTAGAGNGEIEIDGLTHADAIRLRDELLGRQARDGV